MPKKEKITQQKKTKICKSNKITESLNSTMTNSTNSPEECSHISAADEASHMPGILDT